MKLVDLYAMSRAACLYADIGEFKKLINKCVFLLKLYHKETGNSILSDPELPNQEKFWDEYYKAIN